MQVVAPRDWLFLVALGSMVVGAISWSIWGRIPVTVEGRGVLLYPDQTTALQAPVAGQVATLRVKPGDRVQAGQVIGAMARVELQQALQQQTATWQRLRQQQQQLTAVTARQTAAALQALQQQEQALQKTLQDQQALLEPIRTKDRLTLQTQQQSLARAVANKEALAPVLQQQLDNRQQLLNEGAISIDLFLQSAQAYQENQQQLASLKSQLQELNRRSLGVEQTYRGTLRQVETVQAQLQDLQAQKQQLQQRSLEASMQRSNQIQAVQQQIAQLKLQLQQSSQITSAVSGRVVELTAKPGQVLQVGDRIGLVEADHNAGQLGAIAYFSIKDGKRLAPGMAVQITPDSVPRERYGGIVGTVKTISPLPISRQAMVNTVGSTEVADGLVVAGGQLAVQATLQPNPANASGYQWSSSRGPELQLSPGTTAAIRATIDRQAPITFVLPIFKSFAQGT